MSWRRGGSSLCAPARGGFQGDCRWDWGGGCDISAGVWRGGPSEVLYGPWDTKKGLAPWGGGKGLGRGWSRRAVQTALTMEVR